MHVNPAIKKDDLGKFTCPNEGCGYYAKRGKGNIAVNGWSGTSRRFRQLICHACGKTFSENTGTPFYGLKTDREKIVQALRMIVERGSIRGTARAIGVDKDTACMWVRRASEHADAFSDYMLHELHMSTVELDELWTTVKKKQEHIDDEKDSNRKEIGDAMVWKAEALPSRLRVASVVGKRSDVEATELISKVRERSDGSIPLFISDNLDGYPHALLNVYGEKEEPQQEKKRGRPRTRPIIKPPDGLQYAQVIKHRDEHGRIKSIERKVVFGTEEGVGEKLKEAGCYTKISTGHIERDNLSSRQTNARLVRDALSFSKSMEALRWHTKLDDLNYNFCREHSSIRVRLGRPAPTRGRGTPKRWAQRTPAMASGVTDQKWIIGELMAYPIIKPYYRGT